MGIRGIRTSRVVLDAALADYTSGSPMLAVAAKHGLNYQTVLLHAKRAGITRTPSQANSVFNVNQNAFDELSPESSYWIGFLITDGCLYVPPVKNQSAKLLIAIKEADVGHVEKFSTFMESNRPIRRTLMPLGPLSEIRSAQVRFSARCDPHLRDRLIALGVTPRKTMTADAGMLRNDRHFWRGCIDGDGSVMITKSGRPSIYFGGASRRLVEQFVAFVAKACGVNSANIFTAFGRHSKSPFFRISWSGRTAAFIIDHLYQAGDISLDRKGDKATIASRWLQNRYPLLPPSCLRRDRINHEKPE